MIFVYNGRTALNALSLPSIISFFFLIPISVLSQINHFFHNNGDSANLSSLVDFTDSFYIIPDDPNRTFLNLVPQGNFLPILLPNIEVFPDTLTLEWANVFRDTLWVKNTGNAQLVVDTIFTSPNDSLAERLIIQPQSFTVAPLDSQRVDVWEWSIIPFSRFRSQYDFVESLFVVSNDPDDSIHTIIIRGEYSPTNGVEETRKVPMKSKLGQNYPNPFNPSTEIRYQIAELSLVTLRVYNLLGQEVATLVNERQQGGLYAVRWDAFGNPSGVYLYRLVTEAFTDAKKLLFLK